MTDTKPNSFLDDLEMITRNVRVETQDTNPDYIARCNLTIAAKLLEGAGYELARSEKSKYTVTLLNMSADVERILREI